MALAEAVRSLWTLASAEFARRRRAALAMHGAPICDAERSPPTSRCLHGRKRLLAGLDLVVTLRSERASQRMQSSSTNNCGTVLIVDDDEAILETLRDVLTDTGYEAWTAAGGAEALAQLRDAPAPPDVILVDLMMPEMDGWELTARVRQDPGLRDVPVVVMSAGGTALLATAPMADAYLPKPIQLSQLLQVLHRTLTLATIRGMNRKASGTIKRPDHDQIRAALRSGRPKVG
jgi:CheY-like chemotaxis protein